MDTYVTMRCLFMLDEARPQYWTSEDHRRTLNRDVVKRFESRPPENRRTVTTTAGCRGFCSVALARASDPTGLFSPVRSLEEDVKMYYSPVSLMDPLPQEAKLFSYPLITAHKIHIVNSEHCAGGLRPGSELLAAQYTRSIRLFLISFRFLCQMLSWYRCHVYTAESITYKHMHY